MNEGENRLQAWIDPELGASIVSLVLGEASDFETEKLERLIEEKPELARYRKRIETLDGLLDEVVAGRKPEGQAADSFAPFRLSDDRRKALMASIGAGSAEPATAPASETPEDTAVIASAPKPDKRTGGRRIPWRRIVKVAAVLCLLGVLASIMMPASSMMLRSARRTSGPVDRELPGETGVAHRGEEILVAETATEPAFVRIVQVEEDATVPQRGGAQRAQAATWAVSNEAAESDHLLAAMDDSESNAAASLSKLSETMATVPMPSAAEVDRLDGAYGKINVLTGVENQRGLKVASTLDADEDEEFSVPGRKIAEAGSGSKSGPLKMPDVSSPDVRSVQTAIRHGDRDSIAQIGRLGSGQFGTISGDINVQAGGDIAMTELSSPAEISDPLSTGGKTNLNYYSRQSDVSEGDAQSLEKAEDKGFSRRFLGGANELRGFDFREVGPKPDPAEPRTGDNKADHFIDRPVNPGLVRDNRDSLFLSREGSKPASDPSGGLGMGGGGAAPPSGRAPADKPPHARESKRVEPEKWSRKDRQSQVADGTLQAVEQLGAGGYDTVRNFERRERESHKRHGQVTPIQTDSRERVTAKTPQTPELNSAPAGGSINIQGNIKTKDEVIRRELATLPGKAFDGTAIEARGPENRIDSIQLQTVTELEKREPGEERTKGKVSGDDLFAVTELNRRAEERLADPKIQNGIGQHELAYRMQSPVPESKQRDEEQPGLTASGARSGGTIDIGGGFQSKDPSQAGQNQAGSISAATKEMKAQGTVYALGVDDSGSVRATGESEAGGRVILGQPSSTISINGAIQVNRPDGSGGEIFVDANSDGGAPQQSLSAIKDALGTNGATVHWDSFSVSAGEINEFAQPGSEAPALEDVVSGQPAAPVKAARPESAAESLSRTTKAEPQQLPTEGGDVYFLWVDDETAKLNPNVQAGEGAEWATPMAGGDADRNLGRFDPAQREWQRHPNHPATTQLKAEVADGGLHVPAEPKEERAKAPLWNNSQASLGAFAAGNVPADNHIQTSGNGNINQMAGWTGDEADLQGFGYAEGEPQVFEVTEEIFQFSTGADLSLRGDRPKKLKSKPGAVRKWQEGLGDSVDTDYDTRLTVRPVGNSPVTAGLRSGSQSISGDSIDGLISENAGNRAEPELQAHARDYYTRSQNATRAKFQSGTADGWELPDPRSIDLSLAPEVVEFEGFINYRSPVSPGKAALKNRVAPPSGLDEKNAAEESFSTFSLHVSDVSFKLAQAALEKGEWPEAGKVRIEEFVNAFDYGDPMPSQEERVACELEQAIHPFLQQRNLMRVAMRTAAAGRAGDTPLRLTFLLDNSGSMERADREETVRRAFALLADQLQPIDQVTLISFARQPRLLADKVTGDKSHQLVQIVSNLPSEGGTNIEAALQLAFEKAQEQKTGNAQNRIVLLTDGAANLGDAKPESLSRMIESMREEGIAFDAAGIGADGLNDEILEALTRKGDGRYYLLNRPEDADAGFARQIAGALRPAAKNVKVQVEFNPDRVGNYKLLGFEKHRLKKEDFRDDSVDAAEMAAEEAGVAVYQFEAKPDGEGDIGFVSVRFRDMSSGQMVEKRWPIPYEPSAPRPDQAAPSMQIASAAALLAAKLNGEPLGNSVELDELARTVSSLPGPFQNKERVRQLRQMIDQARQLESK